MNHNQPATNIVCIGEAMLELSLVDTGSTSSLDASVKFAGDTLNTAVYLQRLCADCTTVSYCTVVGEDALSQRLIDFIQSEQIDVSTISRTNDRTIGLYAINTDEKGERTFTYWRNQSAAKTLFQHRGKTDFSALENYSVVYLSAITLAILPAHVRRELLQTLKSLRTRQTVKVAFDSNYRPALWESPSEAKKTIESFWRITDIALPSIDDEQSLFNDPDERSLLARFETYNITQGALKRGSIGPVALGKENISLSKDELPNIDAVDTTAAGDSFNAGYLSAVLKQSTQHQALLAGHKCAARVITHRGAIIPLPDW